MQNQNPSDNIQPTSQANVPPTPTPGMSPPAQYPYPPPSIPNGPVPAQYPYPPPYQQQYPPYAPAVSSTSKVVIQSSLIGGSIASGINILITLLLTFVPAIGNATFPLYQFVPLLSSGMLSVGEFIISLIIALLCSPGFFVVGLQTIRKTGKMNSVMLACTLALIGFAAVDLILIITTTAYSLITIPPSSTFNVLEFWEGSLLGWLVDLIMIGMVSFAAAALGAAIGKQQRY